MDAYQDVLQVGEWGNASELAGDNQAEQDGRALGSAFAPVPDWRKQRKMWEELKEQVQG